MRHHRMRGALLPAVALLCCVTLQSISCYVNDWVLINAGGNCTSHPVVANTVHSAPVNSAALSISLTETNGAEVPAAGLCPGATYALSVDAGGAQFQALITSTLGTMSGAIPNDPVTNPGGCVNRLVPPTYRGSLAVMATGLTLPCADQMRAGSLVIQATAALNASSATLLSATSTFIVDAACGVARCTPLPRLPSPPRPPGGGGLSQAGKMNLHGILMSVALALLLPLGIALGHNRWLLDGCPLLWLFLHTGLQLIGVGCLAAGFAIAWAWLPGGGEAPVGGATGLAHQAIGCLVMGLAALQVGTAVLARPAPNAPRRAAWNFMHHWGGRAVVLLGWVTLFLGIGVAHSSPEKYPDFNLGVWVGPVAGCILVILLLDLSLSLKYYRPPATPHEGERGGRNNDNRGTTMYEEHTPLRYNVDGVEGGDDDVGMAGAVADYAQAGQGPRQSKPATPDLVSMRARALGNIPPEDEYYAHQGGGDPYRATEDYLPQSTRANGDSPPGHTPLHGQLPPSYPAASDTYPPASDAYQTAAAARSTSGGGGWWHGPGGAAVRAPSARSSHYVGPPHLRGSPHQLQQQQRAVLHSNTTQQQVHGSSTTRNNSNSTQQPSQHQQHQQHQQQQQQQYGVQYAPQQPGNRGAHYATGGGYNGGHDVGYNGGYDGCYEAATDGGHSGGHDGGMSELRGIVTPSTLFLSPDFATGGQRPAYPKLQTADKPLHSSRTEYPSTEPYDNGSNYGGNYVKYEGEGVAYSAPPKRGRYEDVYATLEGGPPGGSYRPAYESYGAAGSISSHVYGGGAGDGGGVHGGGGGGGDRGNSLGLKGIVTPSSLFLSPEFGGRATRERPQGTGMLADIVTPATLFQDRSFAQRANRGMLTGGGLAYIDEDSLISSFLPSQPSLRVEPPAWENANANAAYRAESEDPASDVSYLHYPPEMSSGRPSGDSRFGSVRYSHRHSGFGRVISGSGRAVGGGVGGAGGGAGGRIGGARGSARSSGSGGADPCVITYTASEVMGGGGSGGGSSLRRGSSEIDELEALVAQQQATITEQKQRLAERERESAAVSSMAALDGAEIERLQSLVVEQEELGVKLRAQAAAARVQHA
ncbi:hypothetical protein FOA52_004803 [Chlamydomonas sp. UWO 241]|nr:hypothetical protein FOA52_004803 [Chlamydomonas sp. UWO 241]